MMFLFLVADKTTDSQIQKKKKVIRRLVQNDISESAAKAAVQSVRTLDLDECYLWAMEYGFDEDLVIRLQNEFDNELGKNITLFIFFILITH